MTNRNALYRGVSRAAWGYFFLYFDINLGSVNILPEFVAFLLFLSSIKLLQGERRDLALLRPLGIFLAIWHLANWLITAMNTTIGGAVSVLNLIVTVTSLYFHFQMLTDFAALAAKYQYPDQELDKSLLKWRTWQTVLITLSALMACPAEWLPDWWKYLILCVAVVGLIACICIMVILFRLRRCLSNPVE